MAEWRVGRSWTEAELEERLARLPGLGRNYEGSHGARLEHPDWETHGSRSVIGEGVPGPPEPDGPFARGRAALRDYAFSDPGIVEAHYDPDVPLRDRRMLLELKVPLLRYLCGVAVGAVREDVSDGATTWGFRYDTLEGHIERGSEWFLLEQDHGSGVITFSIEATWQPGDFPNWWSRVGFGLVGKRTQRRWHTRAHERMAEFVRDGGEVPPSPGAGLAHQGPEVVFTREPSRWIQEPDD